MMKKFKYDNSFNGISRTCKYCQTVFASSPNFKSEAEELGIVGDEMFSINPICKECLNAYSFVRKSHNKDHNINSICMWINFREIDESLVNFDDYERYFFFSIGSDRYFVQLAKTCAGGYSIPVGFMFDRLDDIHARYKSSLKKIPSIA